MAYKILISRRAEKFLKKMSEPYYSSIKNAIISLSSNCRPNGYKKLKGTNAYRIRVGDYRIIYDIKDEVLIIEVVNIGHRKEIYKT